MRIADLLIPQIVRRFRDAVLNGQFTDVQNHLRADEHLVRAEFTASRGIAQAIHHWKSATVAELLIGAGAGLDWIDAGNRFLTSRTRGPYHGLLSKRNTSHNFRSEWHHGRHS